MLVKSGTALGRKVMTVLMVMTMAFTIIPMMGKPSYANRAYFLWVGGTKVTDGAMSGEGWSFDKTSNTLTLNNANITQGRSAGDYCGIYYDGSDDLNIVLKGSNSIKSAQGGTSLTHGIYSQNKYANINISGEGSLSTDATNIGIYAGQDVIINGGSITVSGATGIRADRNVEIEGGTVNATATGDNGDAIYAQKYVDLKGGSVTASGGDGGHGINAGTGVLLESSVRVWAGEDKDNAVDVTDTFKNDFAKYKWVHASACTLWVGGIPVTGRNATDILGNLDEGATASYDYNTETLTLNNYSYESEGHGFGPSNELHAAIYADQKLTIQLEGDNTVKCTEKDSSVGSGIYSAGKDLTISGSGTLIASGYGQGGIGIQANGADLRINGGTVTASGDNGLSANGGSVIINDGIVTAIGSSSDLGISADDILVADKMGINAGDSKETATGVDKNVFQKHHGQHWVQISEAYPLWVRGTLVMLANKDDVLGDGTVSYNPDNYTLILNGANIVADTEKQYKYSAIYYGDAGNNLIIDATKDSTVTGADYGYDPKEKNSYGICSESQVTVRGKLTAAGRKASVSYGVAAPTLVVEDNAEAKVIGSSGGGCITGGSITLSGKLTAEGNEFGIYFYPGSTGIVTVNSGAELTVTGGTIGIVPNSNNGYVEIKKGAKVRAVGGGRYGAIYGTVKNADLGLCWTNTEGSEGKTEIKINEEGQRLGDGIKKAVFPAPRATVTTAPASKELTYNGSAQELVTAGAASDGTMQYALGENDKSEPTNAWSTSIPEGTSVGDYYVWYRAEGDNTHLCSDAACVKAVVNKAKVTVKADDKNCADVDKTDLLTWTMEDEKNKWYEAERADIGLSVTDDKGNVVDPKSSPVGKYTITPSWNNENKNYEATFVPGVFDTNHKYGEWKELDDKQHQKVCEHDSNHVEKEDHSWDEGKVTKVATCTEAGEKTYTCAVCLATKKEAIPAIEHRYGEWKELDDKQHQKVCEHDSNHVEKENHSWDEGKVSKLATCTEEGEKTYTCAVCLATKKEAVPAIEHKFGEWKEFDDKQHQRVCERDSGHVEKEDHIWGEGKVTKEATEQEEGEKVYSCVICQAEKTEVIAKVKPAPLVIPKAGGTQLAKVTTGKKSITIGWDKVQEASGYDIFFSQCNHHGKKLVYRNVKSIKGNDVFTWKMSGLKKGTAYKAYVKAYVMKDGRKYYVKTSPTMHAYTGGGTKKYTNVKSVSVKKAAVSLKKGKTYKIKASLKKLHRGKRLMPKSHVPRLRYLTTDSSVATVNAKGKITAKGKGSCTIYVYAHNGVRKAVKVKVD